MRYLSVCSGIEAATVAWHDLGWEPAAFSEIEKFPSEVLAHHYPTVPNLGDMTKFEEWNLGTIDLLVGGTPCQSFSVAGLRKGLDDPRGNLMLTYLAIARRHRPKWLVWENVPGVLSSNGGEDFASLLRGLVELGYGWAYRVLDAQYFGVAQRRRRVFVVGCLGDWRASAAVLFERDSLCGNPAPSREKRKGITCTPEGIAGTISRKWSKGTGGPAGDEHYNLMVAPVYEMHPADSRVKDMGDVCQTLTSRWGTGGGNVPITIQTETIPLDLRNAGRDPEKHDEMNRQGVGVGEPGDPSHTLTAACVHGVAVDVYNQAIDGDTAATLTEACGGSNTSGPKVMKDMAVRRLTPVECERLQGFPDNYTNIKDKTPDGSRYKALGNSMAVPVMAWIGKRIKEVDELSKQKAA
jgi:DNA (cytosine-5)-methyltransferase 1